MQMVESEGGLKASKKVYLSPYNFFLCVIQVEIFIYFV